MIKAGRMAKIVPKRKSESSLPVVKSKKSRTADHKGEGPDSPETQPSSQEQPVAPKYVKSRAKSRRSAPVSRYEEEYEEDAGRMETQEFLKLIELEAIKKKKAAKASNEFWGKFKSSIKTEEEALKKRIEELENNTEKQDHDFMENFTKAFSASRPAEPPNPMIAQGKRGTPISEIFFATLYDHSRILTSNARSIISRFEEADEKTSKFDAGNVMANSWENENQMAAKVIAIGHKVGVQKIQALLEGEEVPGVDEDDAGFVKSIYQEEGEKAMMGRGWGKVAEKQLKAAGKLYKATLPLKVGV